MEIQFGWNTLDWLKRLMAFDQWDESRIGRFRNCGIRYSLVCNDSVLHELKQNISIGVCIRIGVRVGL